MKNIKENQRVRITKRMIRESLIELLEIRPINKISISELCKRAEINRSTFYNHYENIYDVLDEIGEVIAKDLEEITLLDKKEITLQNQVSLLCTFLKDHPKEAKILLTYFSADDPIIQNIFSNRISAGQVNYKTYILEIDPNTRKLLFHFVIHGIYNLIKNWMFEEDELSPEDIGKLAEDIAKNGWLK